MTRYMNANNAASKNLRSINVRIGTTEDRALQLKKEKREKERERRRPNKGDKETEREREREREREKEKQMMAMYKLRSLTSVLYDLASLCIAFLFNTNHINSSNERFVTIDPQQEKNITTVEL